MSKLVELTYSTAYLKLSKESRIRWVFATVHE